MASSPASRPSSRCPRHTSRTRPRPTPWRSRSADEPAGIEVDLRFTIFRDRAGDRAERHHPERRERARGPALCDEPRSGPARRGLDPARPGRGMGEGAARRRTPARSRPTVRLEHARRIEPPPEPVLRAASIDRPTRRTARPTGSASSIRATSWPRPRSIHSGRPASGSASSPTPSAGASSRARRSAPRRPSSPTRTPASGRCPTRSTVSSGSGWPVAIGAIARVRCSSTTGRRPTSTSMPTSSCGSRHRPSELGVELFVLDDGWFGKRDDDTTSLGDWVVDRRKLPDGIDGVAERITGLGHGLRPLDRARDGQRRERPLPGAPGLGHRHPRPTTHREPPAARPGHGPSRGRRPPRPRCWGRSSRARRSRTSSGT